MRLFVSVPLPPAARAHLAAALVGERTTDVAQWHLTLAFLGEWDDVAALPAGLRAAAAASGPLRLRLRGGGTFPGVLWAGVAGDVSALRALQAAVAAACRSAGVALEQRAFRPHVTVARRPREPRRLDGYEGPEWDVPAVELVRSRLGSAAGGRARHQVLATFPLSPTSPATAPS